MEEINLRYLMPFMKKKIKAQTHWTKDTKLYYCYVSAVQEDHSFGTELKNGILCALKIIFFVFVFVYILLQSFSFGKEENLLSRFFEELFNNTTKYAIIERRSYKIVGKAKNRVFVGENYLII